MATMNDEPAEFDRAVQEVADFLLKGGGMTLIPQGPGTRSYLMEKMGCTAEVAEAGMAMARELHPVSGPSTEESS